MNGDDLPYAFVEFVEKRRSDIYVGYMSADDPLRIDPSIISLAEEFNTTSEHKVCIEEVQDHWVCTTYYDSCEQRRVEVLFPWEDLARALAARDHMNELVLALRAGELVMPPPSAPWGRRQHPRLTIPKGDGVGPASRYGRRRPKSAPAGQGTGA